MLTLDELQSICNAAINFIEYANISHKIKTFLEWREKLVYNEPLPRNNVINYLFNIDKKNKDLNDHVLLDMFDRWRHKRISE